MSSLLRSHGGERVRWRARSRGDGKVCSDISEAQPQNGDRASTAFEQALPSWVFWSLPTLFFQTVTEALLEHISWCASLRIYLRRKSLLQLAQPSAKRLHRVFSPAEVSTGKPSTNRSRPPYRKRRVLGAAREPEATKKSHVAPRKPTGRAGRPWRPPQCAPAEPHEPRCLPVRLP